MAKTVNIDFRSSVPVETKLSNFNPYAFVYDDVECASIEGWIQSLKSPDVDVQLEVCALSGRTAKRAGRKLPDWREGGVLYWKGEPIIRDSQEYIDFVTDVYRTMSAANEEFRNWLISTGDATLTHKVGSSVKAETILTEKEFCDILTAIRNDLHYSDQMEF